MKKVLLLLLFLAVSSQLYATADTFRVIRSNKLQKVSSIIATDLTNEGILKLGVDTFVADDVTPDVSAGTFFEIPTNTGATAITDLSNPVVGQIVYFVGTATANASTIADSGNFALSAAWTASANDVLILYVQADNDYIELGRVDN